MKPIETRYNGYTFRSRLEARWAVFFSKLGIAYEYEREGYDLGEDIYYLPDFWLPAQNIPCWIEIKGQEPTPEEIQKAGLLAAHSGNWVNIFIGDPYPEEFKVLAFNSSLPEHSHTLSDLMFYINQAINRRDWDVIQAISAFHPEIYWGNVQKSASQSGCELPLLASTGASLPYNVRERVLGICPTCGRLTFGWKGKTVYEKSKVICKLCGDLHEQCSETKHVFEDVHGRCHECDELGTDENVRLQDAFVAARSARFEYGEQPK